MSEAPRDADGPIEQEPAEALQSLRYEIDELRRRLDAAEQERADLRRTTSQLQQLLDYLRLPLPTPADTREEWQNRVLVRYKGPLAGFGLGKADIGASFLITGVAAVVVGIVLHVALRTHVIDTQVHLGYIIGLVGVLAFLVGLALVALF